MRVIVFLLIFGLWPGAAEAVVDAGHAFLNGHAPHSTLCDERAQGHDGHEDEAHDEHHCSGLFHLCGCHAPPPTTATLQMVLSPTKWSELSIRNPAPPIALVKPADGAAAMATRPPIV